MNWGGAIFLIFFFSVLLLSVIRSIKYIVHVLNSKKRDFMIVKINSPLKKGELFYSIFCLVACIIFLPFINNILVISVIAYFFSLSLEFFLKSKLTRISGIYRNITWKDGYSYPNSEIQFNLNDRTLTLKYENKSEEKINIINRIPILSSKISDYKPSFNVKILLTLEQIELVKREIVACYCT